VSLLDRLFKSNANRTPVSTGIHAERLAPTLFGGSETLEVVGESHRQEVLWRIVGGRRTEPVRHDVCAILQPEPTNVHDSNAVMVLIENELVGYLSHHDAALYHPGLIRLITQTNTPIGLFGVIVGGGERADGLGSLGVFLDHDPADFGVTRQTAADIPVPGFRTGFSEAVATDLEDDSYDLSWYTQLSPDGITAIKQLRSWLETDPDPIDRHYMMNELEERLYKSRDAFESALEEFDDVCRQHDVEMNTIRPALFEKFGRIPVLDTYRQAAIRCQKARDWAGMRHWAERGLSIYRDQAARQEVVVDLEKRVAYATAKLEAPSKPRPLRRANAPSVAVGTTVRAPIFEMLVCTNCGQTFERERTRGRKPHTCPSCRGAAA
jgi:rubrerythrin